MGNLAAGNHRLTNSIRESLKRKILSHKFDANKFAEHEKSIASLALAVYNHILSEKDRELIAQLPKGWLTEQDNVNVSYGWNDYTQIPFSGCLYGFLDYKAKNAVVYQAPKSVQKPLPELYNSWGRSRATKVTDELSNRITDTLKTITVFSDEIKGLNASVGAVLSSCTTTNKLKDVWPESKPFIEQIFKPGVVVSQSTAVALPINDINQKLGLPVP